jgi:hypothetical protein
MKHMFISSYSLATKCLLLGVLMQPIIVGVKANEQANKDPHRPACTDARCRKINSFLKSHYCGESPFGNGPDDGCGITLPKRPRRSIDVIADFSCEWNESARCEQHGQPTSVVRSLLVRELQRLGLPPRASRQIYFTVWKSSLEEWSVAQAYYSRPIGSSDVELCEVIATIDQNSHVLVLRKLPFQKTDVDVPTVTQWSLVDLADADGDGKVDVVLEGDAYENHWIEVESVQDGSSHTIFAGLGYYL